jgi:RHS repeat-associated protein
VPEGNYTQLTYDARGNVTETRSVGKPGSGVADIVASASYEAGCSNPVTCNSPVSSTDARGQTTDYTYDPTHGGVLSVTAPAPSPGAVRPQTRYTYTLLNGEYRLTGTSACRTQASCTGGADEVKSTWAYDANGNVTATTSGSGDGALIAASAMTYDAKGDLLSVDGPLPGSADTTRMRYNAAREPIGSVSADPDGAGPLKHRAARSTIDARGLVTKVETGTVNSQSDADWAAFVPLQAAETSYDVHARPATAKLVAGGTTHALSQTSYDLLGRPECSAVRMNPAALGSLPGSACQLGGEGNFGPDRIARTAYDSAGRVTETRTGVGVLGDSQQGIVEASTTYRPNGALETLTDGEGNRTTYAYDGHDRLERTRYPVPAKGANASSTSDYEELGYDAAGNVVSRRNRAGEIASYTVDALNRITLKDLPGAEPDVSYTYDLLGNILSASQPGHALSFTYDALGRQLSQVTPQGTTASQYDVAGRRTRLTYPDGFYVTHEHLVTGETSAIKESGTTILATYAYDDQGRRTLITRGNGATTSYAYDPVSRLSQLAHDMAGTSGDVTFTYAYNPAGQIVSRTGSNDAYAWTAHGSGTTSETSNGLNQIAERSGTPVTHDAKGNMLTDGRDRVFGYSSENLLTSFQRPSTGNPANSFRYDPLTRFVQSGPDTGYFVRYHYDAVADVIISKGDPYGEISKFIHGPGQDEPLFTVDYRGRRDWFHADERGSVIARSDAIGSAPRLVWYDEYGQPGANYDDFMYTGAPFVLQGTYLMRNRFYDWREGRFLQADPIGFGDGMNLYAYVGADPVNQIDPSGTCSKEAMVFKTGSRIAQCLVSGDVTTYTSTGFSPGIGSTTGVFTEGGPKLAYDFNGLLHNGVTFTTTGEYASARPGIGHNQGPPLREIRETIEINGLKVVRFVRTVATGLAGAIVEGVFFPDAAGESEAAIDNIGKGEIWSQLSPWQGRTRADAQGRRYQWDYTHKDIEVYNKRGHHLGSMNPTTGQMYKPAVRGRRLRR